MDARKAAAIGHPPARARPQLAQQLVEVTPVAGDVLAGERDSWARVLGETSRAAVAVEAPRSEAARRGAARQSIPTAASAAWVGVEQETAATSSISVRSV